MDLNSIAKIFNRALLHSFSKKKFALVFSTLVLCGLILVFFHGLSLHAGRWVQLSMTFLPVFLCTGILLAAGIILIRIYHDEVKGREVSYRSMISKSWEIALGASYFAIPIVLSYLVLWMILGLFFLLKEIPVVGPFFVLTLSFAPFLINFATLILCLLSIALLFFVAPIIALRGLDRTTVLDLSLRRLERNVFINLVFGLISIFPLVLVSILLTISALMTGSFCVDCQTDVQLTLKWFFFMIPFAVFLAPVVTFFFNFSAESHVQLQKNT